MKHLKVSLLLTAGLLFQSAYAQPLQMPSGKSIQLRLDNQVCREYNKEGDVVAMSVNKDVYDASGQFLLIQKETPVVAIFHTEGEKKTTIIQILPKGLRAIDGQLIELTGAATMADSASGMHKFFDSTLGLFQAGHIISASTSQDMEFDISPQQELDRKLQALEQRKMNDAYQQAQDAQILGLGVQALGQV